MANGMVTENGAKIEIVTGFCCWLLHVRDVVGVAAATASSTEALLCVASCCRQPSLASGFETSAQL